ncbi:MULTISPECIES: hypothetical protein [unclassified Methylocaldum]|nr:hypothetical protein [Methylocaldum sp. RMAD-M]MBP1153120.1 hypothetical protein [Methylocaldum sp. RMAD-M]
MTREMISSLIGFLMLLATGLSLPPETEDRFWMFVRTSINVLAN